jgi:hypothetical protein
MLTLIRQPPKTALCGQCCVAMVAGVSLERATEAVGHGRTSGTDTREIIAALRKLGLRCADRCRRISRARPEYPQRAILVARRNDCRKYHWLLSWDGVIYDPEDDWPQYNGWRITSYLEIF